MRWSALASDAPGASWNLNGATPVVACVARQIAASRRIGLEGTPQASARIRQRAKARFHTWTALADRLRRSPPPPAATGGVVAFVHSAFARGDAGEEAYTGPVLSELVARLEPGRLQLVGLGPRTSFRVRGWRDRLREFADPAASALPLTPVEAFARWRDLADSNAQWRARRRAARALAASQDLRDMSKVEVLDLWPLVEPELEGIATLQFPWSVRAMDEAGAALDALKPDAIVTYAEAGGWGRALMLEARRRGIPTVALQHGFIYRHWLNYRHEPDEARPSPANADDRGFPYPDRTLLFDEYAREYLERDGAFPPASLAVTGSPRLDRLVASARALSDSTRAALRDSLGARGNEAIVTRRVEALPDCRGVSGARGRRAHARRCRAGREAASGRGPRALRPRRAGRGERPHRAADGGPGRAHGVVVGARDRELDGRDRGHRARRPGACRQPAEQPLAVRRGRRDGGRGRGGRDRAGARRSAV